MIQVIRLFLFLFVLGLSAPMMADSAWSMNCYIPEGTYTANWTGHADAESAKILQSAYTELVIGKTEADDSLFCDWFLKLETSDGQQEVYELSRHGDISCMHWELSLWLAAPLKERDYINNEGYLSFIFHKEVTLKVPHNGQSFPLAFRYNQTNEKLSSDDFPYPYFDFYYRARLRHLYLRQSEDNPFILNKRRRNWSY